MPASPQFPAFRLHDGRSIQMESIYRANTYGQLLLGSPDRLTNFGVIHRLAQITARMSKGCGSKQKPCLLPTRVWNLQWGQWEDVEWYRFRTFPRRPKRAADELHPEWMPSFATVARFSSDPISQADGNYSILSVIWFQERFEPLIEAGPLEALQSISWDANAVDLRF